MAKILAFSGTDGGCGCGADTAPVSSVGTKVAWGVVILAVAGIFIATISQKKGART